MDRVPSQPDFARPALYPGAPAWSLAGAQDWAATPLGPAEAWPQSLKTAASIVLGSTVPMFLAWGPDLLLLYNDGYGEILGDRGPAYGKPVREIWADAWERIRPNAERALAGETLFFESEPRTLRRDGIERPVWLTFGYNPILGEDGRIGGVFGAVTAVSHDAAAEDRARESEERFRLIADSAPVPMWVTKLDRKRSFVNRAYVDFVGVSYEESVDYDWRNIIHPDDVERILAESLAGEASLKLFVLEGRFRRADGEWRWLRSISQPRWGPNGEHIGFIGVAPDITEWKLGAELLEGRVAARTADLRARAGPPPGRGRRARAGRGGAAPGAEDGGGRPADRRHRPRFQQPPDAGDRRPRDIGEGRRGAALAADRRDRARIRPARGQADHPIARFLADPADPDGAGGRSTG